MYFLARMVIGPIIRLAVVIAVVAIALTVIGFDPVPMVEQYVTDWLWSQI